MTAQLTDVLRHLEALVACDTRNPPRAITAAAPIFDYLRAQLSGFDIEVDDIGGGCVSLLAVRGAPRILWNFHIDTVPAAPSWDRDPLQLLVTDERAVGLGACDIKGAAACMLAAVQHSGASDIALLFTSDEEAGTSRCVQTFLGKGRKWEGVVVAEPTSAHAVVAHRGIGSAVGRFTGVAGHGASPRALAGSAIHAAVRWGVRALELAHDEEELAIGGVTGIRFNLGRIEGGEKSNMIADRAMVRFGVRPRPGEAPEVLVQRIADLADAGRASWEATFLGPPLPPPGGASEIGPLVEHLGVDIAPPVDFWTEAPLFAAAGNPAIVFGPGDIEQAHTAGEWVALDQLAVALAAYTRALEQ